MSRPGPLVRRARGVAIEHRPAAPSCHAHKVAFEPALSQPFVGERVPELVNVEPLETCYRCSPLEGLHDTPSLQPALLAEPKPLTLGITVARPSTEVAIEGPGDVRSEGQGSSRAALAHDDRDILSHVEVGDLQVGDLRQPTAGVVVEEQQRHVPAIVKLRFPLHALTMASIWS